MFTNYIELKYFEQIRNKNVNKAMNRISNIVHNKAPVGGEKDFLIFETVGKPRDFKSEGLDVKDHVEIGNFLNLIDYIY